VLFDSPVIAEWLDAEHGGHRLLPAEGAKRWAIKKTEALADGLLDSVTTARHERQRDAAQQSGTWIDKHLGKVTNALTSLEQDSAWRGNSVDLGQIAVAAAIGYLELRFAELLDRSRYPQMLAWYGEFAKRPSMMSTAPA
jgi:glutathione S-transferase